MNERDKQFEQQAKKLFDESVERLDAATLSRLNRSRQAALAAAKHPGAQWSRWMPVTAGAVATVLVAVMVMRGPGSDDVFEQSAADFELLLSEESIEMLEELEFYTWLATVDMEAEGDVSDVG